MATAPTSNTVSPHGDFHWNPTSTRSCQLVPGSLDGPANDPKQTKLWHHGCASGYVKMIWIFKHQGNIFFVMSSELHDSLIYTIMCIYTLIYVNLAKHNMYTISNQWIRLSMSPLPWHLWKSSRDPDVTCGSPSLQSLTGGNLMAVCFTVKLKCCPSTC